MLAPASKRIAQSAICLSVLVGVSACAGTREPSYPIPDEPGIYAFTTGDDLYRLDGDRDFEVETWPERSRMPSNVHFVISEPALAGRSARGSVELWRVAWVRSEINAQGQAMPVAGSEWAVAPIEPFSVPFHYESPPGDTSIVHVVPTTPLQPGLYTLSVPGARQARVGVAWNSVDQRQYSAANCVDRYEGNAYRTCTAAGGTPSAALPAPSDSPNAGVTSNGGLASLSAPEPAPAIVQTPAQPATPVASAEGLQIALVDPVRRNDGLIVQGVVINTSNEMRTIPLMQGSLETSAGQEVRRWQFRPPVQTLGPGERANFKTEVRPVPAGVARASVAFIASSR
ncbi:hypothetical protein [Dongia deserti]|uniref:hypothetical protein n=1 Tax=Dongia deserti TaxID=2268030 RepID=UPI000E655DB3|nr:hypothetical protein [Dongia deserti]